MNIKCPFAKQNFIRNEFILEIIFIELKTFLNQTMDDWNTTQQEVARQYAELNHSVSQPQRKKTKKSKTCSNKPSNGEEFAGYLAKIHTEYFVKVISAILNINYKYKLQ